MILFYTLCLLGFILLTAYFLTQLAFLAETTLPKHIVSPLPIETVPTVTPTPKPMTDEEFIKSLPYGEIVWKTYGHESSYGKHDGCRAKGLYNGFGFGEYVSGHYHCYASLQEVATDVSRWFAARLDGDNMELKQGLCYYNTGNKNLYDCDYAEYTLNL